MQQEEFEHFKQRGWVLLRGLIDITTMDELRQRLDSIHDEMASKPHPAALIAWEPDDPTRIRQLMNSEQVCPEIDAVRRHAKLQAAMQRILGTDITLFHSKLMMKAAGSGSFTPWHQDWAYWQRQSFQPTTCNAMLAIDPQTEANGAIQFVDGSHHHGLIEHERLPTSSFNIGLPGDLDAYDATMVCMQPGDVVVFGALVIHGSGPNASPDHRRANTFAFDTLGNQRPHAAAAGS